jgi:hypothetical protein
MLVEVVVRSINEVVRENLLKLCVRVDDAANAPRGREPGKMTGTCSYLEWLNVTATLVEICEWSAQAPDSRAICDVTNKHVMIDG